MQSRPRKPPHGTTALAPPIRNDSHDRVGDERNNDMAENLSKFNKANRQISIVQNAYFPPASSRPVEHPPMPSCPRDLRMGQMHLALRALKWAVCIEAEHCNDVAGSTASQ